MDGHNRYDICRKHGVPFFYEVRSFADKEAAMFWMLEHQLARRNLNSYQRSELALKAKDYYTRIAQANQKAGIDLGLNSAQGGRVSDKLAKLAGVGHDTIKKAKKISENADDDTKSVSFDIIVDFDADADDVRDSIKKEVSEKFSEYNLDIVLDSDYSD